MSLRARLTLAFAVASLAVIGAIAALVYAITDSAARSHVAARLNHIATGMRDRLDAGMYERMQEVRGLARFDAARAAREGPARLRGHLDERQSAHPEFSWIGYTDPAGRVVAATRGMLEGEDVSQRPWWTNAVNGVFVGDVHEAQMLQKLLAPEGRDPLRFVDFAFPVKDLDGANAGVLGAHVSWDWASGLANRVLLAAGALGSVDLLVVRGDGKVLLGPKALEGQVLPPPVAGPVRPDGYAEHRWPSGAEYVSAASLTRGERAYSGLGWQVIARQDRETAFAAVHRLRNILVVAAITGVIVISVLGYFLAGRLAAPLEDWAAAADRIGAGEREVKFPEAPASSELGRLSAALRSMAERLRSKEDLLQARVEERTRALVEAMNALEAERERLAYALDTSRLATWELDVEKGTVTLSSEWARMLGGKAVETVTTPLDLLARVPEEEHAPIQDAMVRLLKGEIDQYDLDHRVVREDGTWMWVRSRGHVTRRSPEGHALRLNGTNADVSLRKEDERRLREQAFTDSVTTLPNRRLLVDRLQVAVARARRGDALLALLYLDLDGFKPVNDTLGHDAGDELLRRVGERLAMCVRASDTVARVGGDEFALLLDPVRDAADVEAIEAKVRAAVREPFDLTDGEARISISIGAALHPRDGADGAALLRAADAAMYRAKAASKSGAARAE